MTYPIKTSHLQALCDKEKRSHSHLTSCISIFQRNSAGGVVNDLPFPMGQDASLRFSTYILSYIRPAECYELSRRSCSIVKLASSVFNTGKQETDASLDF